MRLHCGQRPETYIGFVALRPMPCLLHGSAKSHFKQRICQAGARFFAGMSFWAARFAVESFVLMSQPFLPFSESVGELFCGRNFLGKGAMSALLHPLKPPSNSSETSATWAASFLSHNEMAWLPFAKSRVPISIAK
jgi:hypothetical protein